MTHTLHSDPRQHYTGAATGANAITTPTPALEGAEYTAPIKYNRAPSFNTTVQFKQVFDMKSLSNSREGVDWSYMRTRTHTQTYTNTHTNTRHENDIVTDTNTDTDTHTHTQPH